MITTLLFTALFIIIWYYLRDLINYYKTGDPNENNQRIDPCLLNAFKSTPYTQSLNSHNI